ARDALHEPAGDRDAAIRSRGTPGAGLVAVGIPGLPVRGRRDAENGARGHRIRGDPLDADVCGLGPDPFVTNYRLTSKNDRLFFAAVGNAEPSELTTDPFSPKRSS